MCRAWKDATRLRAQSLSPGAGEVSGQVHVRRGLSLYFLRLMMRVECFCSVAPTRRTCLLQRNLPRLLTSCGKFQRSFLLQHPSKAQKQEPCTSNRGAGDTGDTPNEALRESGPVLNVLDIEWTLDLWPH